MPCGFSELKGDRTREGTRTLDLAGALPSSVAFCPAGISSLFETCTSDRNGHLLRDPARIGARGGGFVISRGVTSRVKIRRRYRTRIEIRINTKRAPDALTTRSAIQRLLSDAAMKLDVVVDIQVRVPIAAGFGSSAAGTLASCLALSDAGNLPCTLNEIGRVAHVAEVINGTGLGTVPALLVGGFVLVTKPGAPGTGAVDRLRFPSKHSILCVHLAPIQTRDILATKARRTRRDGVARTALRAIAANPILPVFLRESRRFGKQAGFETPRITKLISKITSGGAIGATQNMIGEAVHGVVEDSKASRVLETVRSAFPNANAFISRLENEGVRLLP